MRKTQALIVGFAVLLLAAGVSMFHNQVASMLSFVLAPAEFEVQYHFPPETQEGISLQPGVHNYVLCSQNGVPNILKDPAATDEHLFYWVRAEPPQFSRTGTKVRGDPPETLFKKVAGRFRFQWKQIEKEPDDVHFYSKGVTVEHPNLEEKSTLEAFNGGELYYVGTANELPFRCGEALLCGNGTCDEGEKELVCPPDEPCRKVCEEDCGKAPEKQKFCLPCADTCIQWKLGTPKPGCAQNTPGIKCEFVDDVCTRTDAPPPTSSSAASTSSEESQKQAAGELNIVTPDTAVSWNTDTLNSIFWTAPKNTNPRYPHLKAFKFEYSLDEGQTWLLGNQEQTAYIDGKDEFEIRTVFFKDAEECVRSKAVTCLAFNKGFPQMVVFYGLRSRHNPTIGNGPHQAYLLPDNTKTVQFRITDAENTQLTDTTGVISLDLPAVEPPPKDVPGTACTQQCGGGAQCIKGPIVTPHNYFTDLPVRPLYDTYSAWVPQKRTVYMVGGDMISKDKHLSHNNVLYGVHIDTKQVTKYTLPYHYSSPPSIAWSDKTQQLYLFGGSLHTGKKTIEPTADIYAFNPQNNDFKLAATMPGPRMRSTALYVPITGKIIVFFGESEATAGSSKTLNNAVVFDPSTGNVRAVPVNSVASGTRHRPPFFWNPLTNRIAIVTSQRRWQELDPNNLAALPVDKTNGNFSLSGYGWVMHDTRKNHLINLGSNVPALRSMDRPVPANAPSYITDLQTRKPLSADHPDYTFLPPVTAKGEQFTYNRRNVDSFFDLVKGRGYLTAGCNPPYGDEIDGRKTNKCAPLLEFCFDKNCCISAKTSPPPVKTVQLSLPQPPPPPTITQCNDNKDNDNDGGVDYTAKQIGRYVHSSDSYHPYAEGKSPKWPYVRGNGYYSDGSLHFAIMDPSGRYRYEGYGSGRTGAFKLRVVKIDLQTMRRVTAVDLPIDPTRNATAAGIDMRRAASMSTSEGSLYIATRYWRATVGSSYQYNTITKLNTKTMEVEAQSPIGDDATTVDGILVDEAAHVGYVLHRNSLSGKNMSITKINLQTLKGTSTKNYSALPSNVQGEFVLHDAKKGHIYFMGSTRLSTPRSNGSKFDVVLARFNTNNLSLDKHLVTPEYGQGLRANHWLDDKRQFGYFQIGSHVVQIDLNSFALRKETKVSFDGIHPQRKEMVTVTIIDGAIKDKKLSVTPMSTAGFRSSDMVGPQSFGHNKPIVVRQLVLDPKSQFGYTRDMYKFSFGDAGCSSPQDDTETGETIINPPPPPPPQDIYNQCNNCEDCGKGIALCKESQCTGQCEYKKLLLGGSCTPKPSVCKPAAMTCDDCADCGKGLATCKADACTGPCVFKKLFIGGSCTKDPVECKEDPPPPLKCPIQWPCPNDAHCKNLSVRDGSAKLNKPNGQVVCIRATDVCTKGVCEMTQEPCRSSYQFRGTLKTNDQLDACLTGTPPPPPPPGKLVIDTTLVPSTTSKTTYTLTYTLKNTGGSKIENVDLNQQLPTDIASFYSGPCTLVASVLSCNLGSMDPGVSLTQSVTLVLSNNLVCGATRNLSKSTAVPTPTNITVQNNQPDPLVLTRKCDPPPPTGQCMHIDDSLTLLSSNSESKMSITADGKSAYIVDNLWLKEVDTSDMKVKRQSSWIAQHIRGLAVGPNEEFAYLSRWTSSAIAIDKIQLSDLSKKATWNIPNPDNAIGNMWIDVDSTGDFFYVALGGKNARLGKYRTSNGRLVGSAGFQNPDSLRPIGFVQYSKDGKYAYVALGNANEVAKVDLSAMKTVKALRLGGATTVGFTIDEQAKHGYVFQWIGNSTSKVHKIALSSMTSVATEEYADDANVAAFAFGSSIYQVGSTSISQFDPNTLRRVREISLPETTNPSFNSMSIVHDSSGIAYVSLRQGKRVIHKVNLQSKDCSQAASSRSSRASAQSSSRNADAPALTITNPSYNTSWRRGGVYSVLWQLKNMPINTSNTGETFDVEISTNNGSTWINTGRISAQFINPSKGAFELQAQIAMEKKDCDGSPAQHKTTCRSGNFPKIHFYTALGKTRTLSGGSRGLPRNANHVLFRIRKSNSAYIDTSGRIAISSPLPPTSAASQASQVSSSSAGQQANENCWEKFAPPSNVTIKHVTHHKDKALIFVMEGSQRKVYATTNGTEWVDQRTEWPDVVGYPVSSNNTLYFVEQVSYRGPWRVWTQENNRTWTEKNVAPVSVMRGDSNTMYDAISFNNKPRFIMIDHGNIYVITANGIDSNGHIAVSQTSQIRPPSGKHLATPHAVVHNNKLYIMTNVFDLSTLKNSVGPVYVAANGSSFTETTDLPEYFRPPATEGVTQVSNDLWSSKENHLLHRTTTSACSYSTDPENVTLLEPEDVGFTLADCRNATDWTIMGRPIGLGRFDRFEITNSDIVVSDQKMFNLGERLYKSDLNKGLFEYVNNDWVHQGVPKRSTGESYVTDMANINGTDYVVIYGSTGSGQDRRVFSNLYKRENNSFVKVADIPDALAKIVHYKNTIYLISNKAYRFTGTAFVEDFAFMPEAYTEGNNAYTFSLRDAIAHNGKIHLLVRKMVSGNNGLFFEFYVYDGSTVKEVQRNGTRPAALNLDGFKIDQNILYMYGYSQHFKWNGSAWDFKDYYMHLQDGIAFMVFRTRNNETQCKYIGDANAPFTLPSDPPVVFGTSSGIAASLLSTMLSSQQALPIAATVSFVLIGGSLYRLRRQ